MDLRGKPFSICKAVCVYLTVSNEALRAVPNTSIPCFGFRAAPRWAGFLTEVMLVLLGCSWPYPSAWALLAQGRSPALQLFAHSELLGSLRLLSPRI